MSRPRRLTEEQRAERNRARSRLMSAIQRGQFPPAKSKTCVICGQPAAEYHHARGYDAAHALDVDALCHYCHMDAHHGGDHAQLAELWAAHPYLPPAEPVIPPDLPLLTILADPRADPELSYSRMPARKLARVWAASHPDANGYLVVNADGLSTVGHYYRVADGLARDASAAECVPSHFVSKPRRR